MDGFISLGFLPRRRSRARKALQDSFGLGKTLVFFESPRRLQDTLGLILNTLGDVPICVARELTKIHEEFIRGPVSQALSHLARRPEVLGEVVLVVSGNPSL